MSEIPIGMQPQDRSERDRYENELTRIIDASEGAGILLRVIGSLAFQFHCPEFGYLQEAMGRSYTDIDFATYRSQTRVIKKLMGELGYTERNEIFLFSDGGRSIFDDPKTGMYIDVFYDKLDFCHPICWKDRLEVDSPTIPLAEMLLEKMQIVEICEKDVIDTLMLFLEHEVGDVDREIINVGRIAKLCAADWGLWRTITMNLDKVNRLAKEYPQLNEAQLKIIATRVNETVKRIEGELKTLGWRLRAKIGDRVQWYKDVDDI